MKANYTINLKPIDIEGSLTDWTMSTARIKATLTLNYENGKKRVFKAIMCEGCKDE